jgi:hypothetical protein
MQGQGMGQSKYSNYVESRTFINQTWWTACNLNNNDMNKYVKGYLTAGTIFTLSLCIFWYIITNYEGSLMIFLGCFIGVFGSGYAYEVYEDTEKKRTKKDIEE